MVFLLPKDDLSAGDITAKGFQKYKHHILLPYIGLAGPPPTTTGTTVLTTPDGAIQGFGANHDVGHRSNEDVVEWDDEAPQ